jgi:hypothetical protein
MIPIFAAGRNIITAHYAAIISQEFGGILWANSAHGVSSAGCAGS